MLLFCLSCSIEVVLTDQLKYFFYKNNYHFKFARIILIVKSLKIYSILYLSSEFKYHNSTLTPLRLVLLMLNAFLSPYETDTKISRLWPVKGVPGW